MSLADSWYIIFFFIISLLNFRSGGKIFAVSPQAKRVLSLSSSNFKSLTDLSEEMMICLLELYNSLNVWKNSCCVAAAFSKNWISSIIKTSTFLYFALKVLINSKFSLSLLRTTLIKSLTKSSLVTYKTFKLVLFII